MGRWGDGIYESDSALDFFFGTITKRLIRDMVFWFSPEQVDQSARWLTEVLTLIEIFLIFDELKIGTIADPSLHPSAVKRWRRAFFKVWDAEWDSPDLENAGYRMSAYRVEHRHIARRWVQRLYKRALDEHQDLDPFVPKENLPYFSVAGSFFYDLGEMLTDKIVFILSEENRENVIDFFEIEIVWVAIDVIGILCERYSLSPRLKENTINHWFEKMIAIWNERASENGRTPSDELALYTNVVRIFDRLRSLARQYPPHSWQGL
jgi:hypothetical protein